MVREANAMRASGAAAAPAAAVGRAAAAWPGPAASRDAFSELHPGGRLELEAAAGAKVN